MDHPKLLSVRPDWTDFDSVCPVSGCNPAEPGDLPNGESSPALTRARSARCRQSAGCFLRSLSPAQFEALLRRGLHSLLATAGEEAAKP